MGSKSSKSIAPEPSVPVSTSIPATETINKTVSNTTPVTSATPTPAITSEVPATKETSTTAVSVEDTSKPALNSAATSSTAGVDEKKPVVPVTSAVTRWYNWSKFEQRRLEKTKVLWYMKSSVPTTDVPATVSVTATATTTTTLTAATAKTNDDRKETSDDTDIVAIPSFRLRSTAVYSPPHGDRVPSGRRELSNTDISNFKYYHPDDRSKQPAGIHTKATMFNMNTRLKQTSLPYQSSVSATETLSDSMKATGETPSVRTFVSRGLQTDLESQPTNSSSAQVRYYEKQQYRVIPLSALSDYSSTNNGFYHLPSHHTNYAPILAPIEKTPIWSDDPPHSSLLPNPSTPAPPPPPPQRSILKKPSTSLSRELSNPLSKQTHDKVLEQLRHRYKDTKDGTYRVKKVHLLEKGEQPPPPTVSFDRPVSKASQSILRSERLFSSQLFNRKK